MPGDITQAGAPDDIVRRTLERFGRVDILVNNAAMARSTRFADLTADDWRMALEVNIDGAVAFVDQAVLPAKQAQHIRRIINISSSAGRTVSTLGGALYHASKRAGLTKELHQSGLANELGAFGITVNAICPGMIDTELTPAELASPRSPGAPRRRLSHPALVPPPKLADLICFVASGRRGVYHLEGLLLDINGGDLMM